MKKFGYLLAAAAALATAAVGAAIVQRDREELEELRRLTADKLCRQPAAQTGGEVPVYDE